MSDDRLARIWAGWRLPYLTGDGDRPSGTDADHTLFESVLHSGLPDHESYIVWRGETCFALLNAYPYTCGHVMVLPRRGVARLLDLTGDEYRELWQGVGQAVGAVESAYQPHGVNVGLNLGVGAGAGVPDHLHVHVVPRWTGDTNFMTAIAEARVLPEALGDTWRRIVEAWPEQGATPAAP